MGVADAQKESSLLTIKLKVAKNIIFSVEMYSSSPIIAFYSKIESIMFIINFFNIEIAKKTSLA